MTLTRRARGAWPIVGAVLAFAARDPAPSPRVAQAPAAAAHAARPASIAGRLVAPDGRPLRIGAVILTPLDDERAPAGSPEEVWIAPDGAFRFGHVPAGRYRIRARGETAAKGLALFATFTLTLEGRDVEGVQMMLRPGGTLDGELVLDTPHAARAPARRALRVRAPLAAERDFGDPLGGVVQADGSFAIRSLMTGDHQVVVEGLPYPWVVKSVLLRGRDIADSGFEVLEAQQLRGARITITDEASEVSGRVRDNGSPVGNTAVLVYPVAPQFWLRTHRRMRLTRSDADGRFSVRGLPEGEYLAIAGAIEEADLGRRDLLDALRGRAAPLSISGPDARVTLDVPFLAVLPGAPMSTR
jgi:hypothetical protein